jgi:hypothetical protein
MPTLLIGANLALSNRMKPVSKAGFDELAKQARDTILRLL